MSIIDFHVHVGKFNLLRDDIQDLLVKKPFEEDVNMPELFSDPKCLQPYLERNGVKRAIILAECGPGTNFTIDSELVSTFADKNSFFIPFGNINPQHHDVEKEFLYSIELGVVGFKLYPADHGFNPGINQMLSVYKECERRHLPIIFHTGLTAQRDAKEEFIKPTEFSFIAENYPELKIIFAHAGKPHWFSEALHLARVYPNVCLDTALISISDLIILCTEGDDVIDKIIFGSDWPVSGSYNKLINSYLNEPILKKVMNKILYDNANKLLGYVEKNQGELVYV